MKNLGYLYIIVGIIGLLGSLVAAFVNYWIGDALSIINSETPPPGTDIATLQTMAQSVSPFITIAWIWIIAILVASVVSTYFGVLIVRGRVTISRK